MARPFGLRAFAVQRREKSRHATGSSVGGGLLEKCAAHFEKPAPPKEVHSCTLMSTCLDPSRAERGRIAPTCQKKKPLVAGFERSTLDSECCRLTRYRCLAAARDVGRWNERTTGRAALRRLPSPPFCKRSERRPSEPTVTSFRRASRRSRSPCSRRVQRHDAELTCTCGTGFNRRVVGSSPTRGLDEASAGALSPSAEAAGRVPTRRPSPEPRAGDRRRSAFDARAGSSRRSAAMCLAVSLRGRRR